MDEDHCYRAASSRDGRFDGTFVTAVLTTGIYCRPSCPATTPRRRNVRFYPTPAAAQDAGFRACKRCRPDAAPGSPDWDARADLVARAVRLIGDGVVEREGVEGLSRRLGYSSRQLHRLVSTELGTGPLRLAMAHRLQHARALLENTDLAVTHVAWAAGFGSIRQFNDRFRQVYALTPSEIRGRPGRRAHLASGQSGAADRPIAPFAHSVEANLTYRPPLDLDALLRFLSRRAVPGVERWDGRAYTKLLDLPCGRGMARIPAAAESRGRAGPVLCCTIHLEDIRDYPTAVSRLRRLLDLDADPGAVAGVLGSDPHLGPMVLAAPGRRVPGSAAPFETAVQAVIGQQVSVASARVATGRVVAQLGRPVTAGGDWHAFPRPEDLAAAEPARLPLPGRRAQAVVNLSREVAAGRICLDPGSDRDRTERLLLDLPGIGPWTAAYIRLRALGDPDVFPPGDAALERARATLHGGAIGPTVPATWKPWRSYAVAHLWAIAGPERSDGTQSPRKRRRP